MSATANATQTLGVQEGRRLAIATGEGRAFLQEWIKAHRSDFDTHMMSSGAVLFRGFPGLSIGAFQQVAPLLCGALIKDNPEHAPVSADGLVQTPVAYPADRFLLWHNENSFNDEWPLRIAFCCFCPAQTGGETPIVDSCRVYREIDPAVRSEFESRDVAYIRNYKSGVGLDWRSVFHSDDCEAISTYCGAHGITAEWHGGELLRTISSRPAVIAHPTTGERSWFNQAQHWHPGCLDSDVREALERSFGDSLPRNCTFGDGAAIPDELMRHVVSVYQRCEVVFPWKRGDVLVLDNVLWAHGRKPYQGERRMLVALGTATRFSGELAC